MQKIYRRKNDEIPKDYVCTEGCGKAYGSHAALYTHMKNKHGSTKINNSKGGESERLKTGRKGRPLTKQKEFIIDVRRNTQHICKLCFQNQCICDSSINYQDVQKNITIMSDRMFLKLLHAVSNLSIGQHFTWIRSTEDDCEIFTKIHLCSMMEQLNQKIKKSQQIYLTQRWQQYLLHLSKFINPKYILQLFEGILVIASQKKYVQTDFFSKINQQYKNLKNCSQQKPKQWSQFIEVVSNI